MILKFPDINTLRLALISGAVPASVALTPASGGYDDDDALWVETDAALPRGVQNDLKKLGVQVARASGSTATADVSCWPELLPLQADNGPIDRPEQTPILFDLPGGAELSRFITEILRLGNDRQSYRWLDPSPLTPLPSGERGRGEGSRALLRVVGPPYYTLLRAIERNGDADGPRAFLERAPRVWVELGWTHPLVEQLKPADGQLLFLQPPSRWTTIKDAPFHDIYEVLEFPLPNAPSQYQEGQLTTKVKVTPTLKRGGSPDVAEMWIVTDNPLEEVNTFVQNAEENTLHRLLFAVGEKDGRQCVVLRVRPSKLPPLDLALKGQGYRAFAKLPNLFLPVGTYLHPEMRRDVVRNLFAEDASVITWLTPGPDGTFTPQRIYEDAFHPLIEWIEYVLDHDRLPLQKWVQAAQFEFEPFICDEDHRDKPKKPPSDKVRQSKKGREFGDIDTGDAALFEYVDKSRKPDEPAPDLDPFSVIPQAPRSELEIQRLKVEEQFVGIPGGLDVPERQQLWPELARLNTALGNTDEGGICWLNAMWNEERIAPGWKRNWFLTEARAVPNYKERGAPRNRSWVTALLQAPEQTGEVSGDDLDRLLTSEQPTEADVRALAAYIVWASGRTPAPAALMARLQPVQHFLEKHERLLPVRAVWLAWTHLVQLSRGDVLALARTRDRLLERLFQNGLRPEKDMPAFLRSGGQPAGTRFRNVRQFLVQQCENARKWSDNAANKGHTGTGPTKAYIDLVFAYGLARLGENDPCNEVLFRATEMLDGEPHPHRLLLEAFNYRIGEALHGRPAAGALTEKIMSELEKVPKLERYAVDRMRQFSRILEPDTKLDPYRHWGARMSELDKALSELADLFDRKQVTERVTNLLRGLPKSQEAKVSRARILLKSLEIAPRVSEEFSRTILDQVTSAFDELPPPPDPVVFVELHAELLEKALFVAAHFDRLEHIQPLISRFQALLESKQGDYALQAMDKLAGRCLRGLRKLGMRDEIDHLLKLMAKMILGDGDLKALMAKPTATTPAALRALLHVAGGWYYFGRDGQAEPVMQAARTELLRKNLEPKEKTPLAVAYAATLGQAPDNVSEKRLEELFTKAEGFNDNYTTARYFSRYQLEVVEAVVLAVVSDDFTMGSQARRWLDDDEFLVRRRIHRDMKAIMAHA